MRRSKLAFAWFGGCVLLAGCDASPSAANTASEESPIASQSASEVANAAFTGEVAGSIAGPIAGPGILVQVADEASPDGKGYSYLADNSGIRDYGITFTLPDDIAPGRHLVTSPDPFGENPEVGARIDQDTGTATISWYNSVEGELVLDEFPDPSQSGSVRGWFNISATNGEGDPVTSTGSFDFEHRPG